ncbi:MAG: SUMF1/EgtB/PvdO family nonheme iron enzyme [Cyanobacteria bacterium P01_F01_bin.143]
MTRIFISHSHSDEAIADKLVDFLLAALDLKEKDILYTCNPDHGLSLRPSSITNQIKDQLKNSEALIILITEDSLHSAWILFEAGSFWTTDKLIIPILGPGLSHNDLSGPLKSFLNISIEDRDAEDKLNHAISLIVEDLNVKQKFTKRRKNKLQEFSATLRAWQSKRPESYQLQIVEVEKLKSQIQELEQSQKEYLQKIELAHKKEKQKLEQQLQKERACSAEKNQELERLRNQEQSQIDYINGIEVKSFNFKIARLDRKVKLIQHDSKKSAQYFEEYLGNNISLKLVYIPGGQFLMGTEDEEIERLVKKFNFDDFNSEKPQHKVAVQPFFMGQFQVTQAQWEIIASFPKVKLDLNPEPSYFKDKFLPVEKVSWDDAVEFCERLSQHTEKKYRLPSEAEWEYSCRAGTNTPFSFGETITGDLVNYDSQSVYKNELKRDFRNKTIQVSSFYPNAFGLNNMHGNVWEWCQDDWERNYQNSLTDGRAKRLKNNQRKKIIRGGAWCSKPFICRAASRVFSTQGSRDNRTGFRVVCMIPKST